MTPSLAFFVGVFVWCLVAQHINAFVPRALPVSTARRNLFSMHAFGDTCGQINFDSCVTTFLTAAVKGDPDYVYGAVSSPDWVLPVGAVAVILTAAIPILLRPGEKALDQQRENEATVGSEFNKRKNKDLR